MYLICGYFYLGNDLKQKLNNQNESINQLEDLFEKDLTLIGMVGLKDEIDKDAKEIVEFL